MSVKSTDTNNITFELVVRNNMNLTSQSITWACDNGNLSSAPFTLDGNQQRIENFSTVYSSPGSNALACNATSNDGNDAKTLNFNLTGIKIEDYNSTALAENQRTVNFTIKNYWTPSAVTWYMTSDGQTFTNTTSTLSTNGTALVSQTINYTTDGNKNIIINISSGSMVDRYNESFTLKALKISNYDSLNLTSTDRLLKFDIKNNWYQNQTVNWNITNPSLTGSNATNLTAGESLFILFENNYTTQGINKPQITAYNNSFISSFADRFVIKVIEILRHLVLYESQNNTISEIEPLNNMGQTNVSWSIDTGEENISSSQSATLNNSEGMIIIINNNYTTSNVHINKPTVNSSMYNDSSSSIVTG
ncbi:MAG: hypothetical protein HYW23_01235 [Candidatus Aenigmarchaeota archaeon]|nr:hypothetical protein [Candidatus Aenigmarchaeota archaeon]